MPRFHCPVSLPVGGTLALPAGAARHVQVLRLQPGDTITLFNGEGGECEATVTRMGRSEVQVQIVSHTAVAEAAAVGRPDELKGQALVVFVTLKPGNDPGDATRKALGEHVAKEIGKFARPDEIRFADGLPKTRSGKIMRRLLKDVAAGRESTGDTSTLEDFTVLAKLRADEE